MGRRFSVGSIVSTAQTASKRVQASIASVVKGNTAAMSALDDIKGKVDGVVKESGGNFMSDAMPDLQNEMDVNFEDVLAQGNEEADAKTAELQEKFDEYFSKFTNGGIGS